MVAYICEVRPVMAQNAVYRHESTYTNGRAAIVMTTYAMLNPRDAPGYGNYFFVFVFPAQPYGDSLRLVLISILFIHPMGLQENIN